MKNQNSNNFVGFIDAIRNFFEKYADYKGTATRAEYWWIQLFFVLIAVSAGMFFILGFTMSIKWFYFGMIIYAMFIIATIIPRVTLTIRRMHDIGISGWWFYFINLIALILSYGGEGLIVFGFSLSIINTCLLCLPSVLENNKYRERTIIGGRKKHDNNNKKSNQQAPKSIMDRILDAADNDDF